MLVLFLLSFFLCILACLLARGLVASSVCLLWHEMTCGLNGSSHWEVFTCCSNTMVKHRLKLCQGSRPKADWYYRNLNWAAWRSPTSLFTVMHMPSYLLACSAHTGITRVAAFQAFPSFLHCQVCQQPACLLCVWVCDRLSTAGSVDTSLRHSPGTTRRLPRPAQASRTEAKDGRR